MDALSRRRGRVVTALAALAAAAAYAFFYYKYVPLVPGFQAILAPVLAGVFLATYSSVERGLLALVFVLPLINNLPYWFGIHLQTPHAPTALPLILTFGLGLIVRKAVFPSGPDAPCRPLPLRRPIAGLSALIVLSAVINLLRHMDFFPFRSDGILELVVNAGGVRAGGAIMSTVFSSLSYLTGFFLFAAVYRAAENRAFIHRLLRVLAVAALLSLLFAVIQKTWAPGLGNTPYWVHFGQINGTFKDPNSFGGFLAAFVPLALGLAFSARGGARVLGFAVAALALAIFPAAGSRSSLLAMAAGLILFFGAAVYQISRRGFAARRRRQIVAVVLVLAVAALGFFGSKLHTRLSWSIEALTGRLTLGEFFNYRLTLWSAAFRMIAAYPLTGVGVGGFIIELPNTLAAEATGRIITDSALNYFFQGGAELGTAGLALLFWIFGALAWRMIRTAGRFSGGEARPDFIAIGAAAGVAAFLVSFVFHSYIGSFEVIGFFWLLAALLFRRTEGPGEAGGGGSGTPVRTGGRSAGVLAVVAAASGVLLFGAVHLRNSLGPLSIERQTEKFGWLQDFGFYARERDDRGFEFRWSGARAGLGVRRLGVPLVVPVAVMHPDIHERPVSIRIYRADSRFRKVDLYKEHLLRDKEWTDIEIGFPASRKGTAYFLLEPDRTWNPRRDAGSADGRDLGFAMGEPWYRHDAEIPAHTEKKRRIFPEPLWEGTSGGVLSENGTARMTIKIEDADVVPSALVIFLRGVPRAGIWPQAVIRLGGSVIGRTVVRSEDWAPIVLYPALKAGTHTLSIDFINGFPLKPRRPVRSLELGQVMLFSLL